MLESLGDIEAPTIKSLKLVEKTQYLVIELNGQLVKGHRYSLYTDFTGELADDLGGFYRSEYNDGDERKYVKSICISVKCCWV